MRKNDSKGEHKWVPFQFRKLEKFQIPDLETIKDHFPPTCSGEVSLSFIILTWNSGKYIRRCIDSYAKSVYKERLIAEFLIVDNGSSDNTIHEIETKAFPNLPLNCSGKLFRLNENQGTTKSRNIALSKAKGRYIAVCDSDTEHFLGSWKKAITYLSQNEKVGILAPCLIYPDGTIQNSVKKFPTITDKLSKLGEIFFNLPIGKSDFYPDFPWDFVRVVDTAISACWIFRKEILTDVGFLDENIFYSPEDIDFCLRVWKNGKKVVFYPQMKITHHTQQISHNKPFSKISLSHFLGLLYYFKKHRYLFSYKSIKRQIDIYNT